MVTLSGAGQKEELQELTFQFPNLQDLIGAVGKLLEKTVGSIVIDALKDDSELSAWSHEGLGLHTDSGSTTCLFCGLELPSGRLDALESHFNAEFEEFLVKLNTQISLVRDAYDAASSLTLPVPSELYDDLTERYAEAISSLRSTVESVVKILKSLEANLLSKRGNVFRPSTLKTTLVDMDNDAVANVNSIISEHNDTSDEFEKRVNEAREMLESDSLARELSGFEALTKSAVGFEILVNQSIQIISDLESEINDLQAKLEDHRKPAEELNSDLQRYLGHGDLQLEVNDSGYAITRSGNPAISLSEGERTAIALLYFLKSLEDDNFDLTSGTVVLDDPVSSLDANSLFLAFGYIRQRTETARQLLILTHNFAFFRQVRNWFKHIKGQRKPNLSLRPARFFMLDCSKENMVRRPNLKALDPLLENYESEYHYLFACVYRAVKAAPPESLGEMYGLPNVARRMLESFLAFKQPGTSDGLEKKLSRVDYDEAAKLQILRFLHTSSHGDEIEDPELDLSGLSEGQSVLAELLALVKSEDVKHYNGMIDAINNTADDE